MDYDEMVERHEQALQDDWERGAAGPEPEPTVRLECDCHSCVMGAAECEYELEHGWEHPDHAIMLGLRSSDSLMMELGERVIWYQTGGW